MTASKTSNPSTKAAAIKSSLIVAEDATLQNIAADNAAIPVQSTSPAPIIADVSNALETFTARPAVAATLSALNTTGDGLKSIWQFEAENKFGLSVANFAWDIFTAVALPLLSLVWLALNKGYVWAIAPQTSTAAAAKWQALQEWAAPKFNYEATEPEA